MTTTGHCLCGAVAYAFDGAPVEALHCHCEDCRRHTGAPIATFVMVERAKLRFTKAAPNEFISSPGVRRSFCGRCGTPIAYASDRRPDIVDLFAGTLDDPSAVKPSCHVQVDAQVPWLEVLDELPRFARFRGGAEPIRHGPKR
jgi:hypothetical protein